MIDTSRAFLFLESSGRVYRCQLTKPITTLGSAPENDITIHDESVKPLHAQVSCADGVYTLRNIDDTDVKVDAEDLDGTWELSNGERIQIGEIEILFAREQRESPVAIHLMIHRPDCPPMGFWSAKSPLIIGRDKGDIILDDPLLSRVQAVIENFCDDGQFLLDARSERGTRLNGELVNSRRRLKDGDLLTFGDIEIEFRSKPFETPTGQDASRLLEEYRRLRAYQQSNPEPSSVPEGSGISSAPKPVMSRLTTNQSRLAVSNEDISSQAKIPLRPRAKASPALGAFGSRPSEISTRLNKTRDGLWYLPAGESDAVRLSSPQGKPIIKAARKQEADTPIEETVQWDVASSGTSQPQNRERQGHKQKTDSKPSASPGNAPGARPSRVDRWYVPSGSAPKKSPGRANSNLPWYLPKNSGGAQGEREPVELDEAASKRGGTRSFGDE